MQNRQILSLMPKVINKHSTAEHLMLCCRVLNLMPKVINNHFEAEHLNAVLRGSEQLD